jgi:hypothetical protein
MLQYVFPIISNPPNLKITPLVQKPIMSASLSGLIFTRNENFLLPLKPGMPQLRRYHLEGRSRFVPFVFKFEVDETTTRTVSANAAVAVEYQPDLEVLLSECVSKIMSRFRDCELTFYVVIFSGYLKQRMLIYFLEAWINSLSSASNGVELFVILSKNIQTRFPSAEA